MVAIDKMFYVSLGFLELMLELEVKLLSVGDDLAGSVHQIRIRYIGWNGRRWFVVENFER